MKVVREQIPGNNATIPSPQCNLRARNRMPFPHPTCNLQRTNKYNNKMYTHIVKDRNKNILFIIMVNFEVITYQNIIQLILTLQLFCLKTKSPRKLLEKTKRLGNI